MLNTGLTSVKPAFIKKLCFILALVLCFGMLPACEETGAAGESVQKTGNEGSAKASEGTEYDIFAETEQLMRISSGAAHGQYYQGEPVLLWARSSPREDGERKTDICLYRRGDKKQVLFQDLPEELGRGVGFLDEEGFFYNIQTDMVTQDSIITKYGASGEIIYTAGKKDVHIDQMCSLLDGTIILHYVDNAVGESGIGIMDAATGTITEVELEEKAEWRFYVGTDGQEVYLLDNQGISRIDLESGERTMLMGFEGSSYALDSSGNRGVVQTFWVKEDGRVNILRNVLTGGVWLETLERKALDKEKTTVTIRGMWMNESWLKDRIAEFNRLNTDCYVKLEVCGEGTSGEDYITRTGMELSAGQGPDILYGDDIFGDSLYSVIQKGGLEDLAPYMERSGIRQEDYFPEAFCSFQNEGRVYAVNTGIRIHGEALDDSLLEGMDSVDIHGLIHALLARSGTAFYQMRKMAGECVIENYVAYPDDILQTFLQGSENLWGMVDWGEKPACNFDTELFRKLLQAAKELGYDERKNYPSLSKQIGINGYYSLQQAYNWAGREGKTVIGILFDEGCHGMASTDLSIKMNANSPNKEEAWRFISYLLSREVQETKDGLPVHREVFAAQAEGKIGEKIMGADSCKQPLTEEDVEKLEAYLEDARFLPIRVQPIIDIIKEEAQDYFEGIKDIDQVRDVIENKVQLYLDENSR